MKCVPAAVNIRHAHRVAPAAVEPIASCRHRFLIITHFFYNFIYIFFLSLLMDLLPRLRPIFHAREEQPRPPPAWARRRHRCRWTTRERPRASRLTGHHEISLFYLWIDGNIREQNNSTRSPATPRGACVFSTFAMYRRCAYAVTFHRFHSQRFPTHNTDTAAFRVHPCAQQLNGSVGKPLHGVR